MERNSLFIVGLVVLISTGCIQTNQNVTTTTQITNQQNPTTTVRVTNTTMPLSHLSISNDVELVTDKTSYSLGEPITIQITNNGNSTVSYEIPVERPLVISVLKEGIMLRISEPTCLSVPALSRVEIPPNTTSTLLTWNQKHYVGCNLSNCYTGGDLDCEYVQASEGKYTLLFAISKGNELLEKIEKDIWIETLDWRACQSDSDCIIVNENHCSCGNSGKRTAINKEFKGDWEGKIKNETEGLGCYTVVSNHWTCREAVPKCVNNTCILIRLKDHAGYDGPISECGRDMNKTECVKHGGDWDGYCKCIVHTV